MTKVAARWRVWQVLPNVAHHGSMPTPSRVSTLLWCPVEDRRSHRRRKVHVRSKLIVSKAASPGSPSVEMRHSEVELQPQGDRKGGRSLWRR